MIQSYAEERDSRGEEVILISPFPFARKSSLPSAEKK